MIKFFFFLLAALVPAASTFAQLVNGSFETPATSTFLQLTNNDSRLTGWRVVQDGGPITVNNSLVQQGYPANDGNNNLVFNSGNSPTGSSIEQSFATTVSSQYTVRLNVSELGNGQGNFAATVSIVSTNATNLNVRLIAPSGPAGVSTSLVFTASSSVSTLRIVDTSVGTSGADLLIDNVTVAEEVGTNLVLCTNAPAGMISFWKAEGSATDSKGTNDGVLAGNTVFANGKVGQGFQFDGNGDAFNVGNPANLRLQSFTIEAWVKRNSASSVSTGTEGNGLILGYGSGGYAFYLSSSGELTLGKHDVGERRAGISIADTNFHHLAVTKTNGAVRFYVDGIASSPITYDPGFEFNTSIGIGGRVDNGDNSFLGVIDELSVFNRALTAAEIQSIFSAGVHGKCGASGFTISQPQNQTNSVGTTATFTVETSGGSNFVYQWRFQETDIVGATNSSLILTNVQLTNAGSYRVQVSGLGGTITSDPAFLTVVQTNSCDFASLGMVGFWKADGNAIDTVSVTAGTLVGDTVYRDGKVGEGFQFDGSGDAVNVGNPTELRVQSFTIEAWIKRNNTNTASFGTVGNGVILAYGTGGYAFYLTGGGELTLGKNSVSERRSGVSVTDTKFHHVAVTKTNETVIFYVDGVPSNSQSYDPGFVFTTSIGIGGRVDNGDNSFIGIVDEVSVYNRALHGSEIEGIYLAGAEEKCSPAQIRIHQPRSRTNYIGEDAIFQVIALGTPPFTYQWLFGGTNILDATNSVLTIPNVSTNNAGAYSVLVTSGEDSLGSSNALLTVLPVPACSPAPTGLVAWWKGEGDTFDSAGEITGSLVGNASYATGRVGQGFAFDGNGDAVNLGNPAALRLQNFSVEAWIKRSSPTTASQSSPGWGMILAYGTGGFSFYLRPEGSLTLARDSFTAGSSGRITDTEWHHVAVTKTNNAVNFYIDGLPAGIASLPPVSFTFSTDVAIGAKGGTHANSFLGSIDEVSFYNRVLSSNEVSAVHAARQAGKCDQNAPLVVTQPLSRTNVIGSMASFAAGVIGTKPLEFQWLFNGTNISGATNASLMLSNVQPALSGNYSVIVSNAFGSVSSSNALLSVVFPPALIRAGSSTNLAGSLITVPVHLVANGNENALGFSLNFNTQALSFAGLDLGAAANQASVLFNTNQAGAGRIGVAIGLSAGESFAAGIQEVILAYFTSPLLFASTNTTVSFGDNPTLRQLSDTSARVLSAGYSNATITLLPSELEADSSPRPLGDRALSIIDWVQVGRFVARLDTPESGSEFQRADSAPRSTFGDGELKVTDWVQAGRYAAALDPVALAGGPTNPVVLRPAIVKGPNASAAGRELRIANATGDVGVAITIPVLLEAQGNESAVTFSVTFDPARFAYRQLVRGAAASSASLLINTNQMALGRIGVTLGNSAGSTFPVGTRELVVITLVPLSESTAAVSLGDQPVPKGVSDAEANELESAYVGGAIVINKFPFLSISHDATNVQVSWPLGASNFVLQSSADATVASGWTNVNTTPVTNGARLFLNVPTTEKAQFYRLKAN